MRAEALAGRTVAELAAALGARAVSGGVRQKGTVGELVERALGASAGATAQPDFPTLGVELKTIPIDVRGHPRESTFISALRVGAADAAEWPDSPVRRKLAHVLWLPVICDGEAAQHRRFGVPVFWRPTADQETILRADFEDLVGAIGAGGIERLTARDGRWLQVRPKAAHARVRAAAPGDDGAPVATCPRGFYLRARFTGALLADPAAVPP